MPARNSRFAKMTLDQLVEMGKTIGREVERKMAEERRWLEDRLTALASYLPGAAPQNSKGNGHAAKPKRASRAHPLKGRKAPIKFRGPKGETWSGRGLAPRWLTALESKGKKREKFLV